MGFLGIVIFDDCCLRLDILFTWANYIISVLCCVLHIRRVECCRLDEYVDRYMVIIVYGEDLF